MPRYNVQHPTTKEWRCFSSIVDDWVTGWMDEKRYQKWREAEYGRLADGDVDENGNVNIDGSVEHTDIRFEHEEWDGEFRTDSPLITSVIISVFKNGRSKSNVRFCKDFADWAKTGKAFAEFGRKLKDEFPISALKEG